MIDLINSVLGIVAIQLLICGWIGFALIAIYRRKQKIDWLTSTRLNFIHLVFSPVAGLLLLYWIAVLSIPFPQAKMSTLVAMLALCTWENVKFIKNRQSYIFSGIVLVAFMASLFILIIYNGQDMIGIPAHEYFPRTNGDTFSYLSHIDQYRFQPMNLFHPLEREYMVYPAAYTGYYDPLERNGVSALGSFFANGLNLETHIAFFSTLRLMLVCMILGLLSILLLLNLSPWIVVSCCSIYIFGSFYIHSVLQQFFSASAGIVASIGTIICICLWIQSGYRRLEAFLAGASLGLLLIYSPENFPTLFIASVFFLLLSLADWRAREKLKNIPLTLLTICGGALAISLPLIFEPATLIWSRLISLKNYSDPPYTSEDYMGFGLHLVGLRSGLGRSAISNYELVVLYILVPLIFIGSSLLLTRALSKAIISTPPWNGRKQAIAYMSVLSATYAGIQLIYLFQGLTYPWIKTVDYFNFLPCIIIALGMDWIAGERKGLSKSLAVVGILAFSAIFIIAAIPAKNKILSFYRSNVLEGPPLDAFVYAEPLPITVTGISPAMRGFSLELFYWMNRFRKTPLEVHMADKVGAWASYRYLQDPSLVPEVSHHFCLEQKWNIPEIQKDCKDLTKARLTTTDW